MDIPHLPLEELQRLTPEERQPLAPEQLAAELEALDPDLRLTPQEQQQREAAWMLANATTWRAIASSCVAHVVESHRRGDIDDLREALGAIHRAAIGCWAQD